MDMITTEVINEEEVAEVVIDHIKAVVDIITTITILMKIMLKKKEVIKSEAGEAEEVVVDMREEAVTKTMKKVRVIIKEEAVIKTMKMVEATIKEVAITNSKEEVEISIQVA